MINSQRMLYGLAPTKCAIPAATPPKIAFELRFKGLDPDGRRARRC